MQVIIPITIDNTALTASNVAEDDYAEWDVATAYAIGDRVIVIGTTHKVYEASAASTGEDPVADVNAETKAGDFWLEVGATNRWKAFDKKIYDKVTRTDSITYTILVPTGALVNGIAFFGLAGGSAQIVVKDGSAVTVYDETVSFSVDAGIDDWYSYFFDPVLFDSESLTLGIPGFAGHSIEITINAPSAGAQATVGQIVLGEVKRIGTTIPGTTVGSRYFSLKERDGFGNVFLIPRASAQTVNFRFILAPSEVRTALRIVAELEARPTVWFSEDTLSSYGTTIFGTVEGELDIPLVAAGVCTANLEIEGLI